LNKHLIAVPILLGLALNLPAPAAIADEAPYYGLLPARDLTFFGFLRLDMRPAHAVSTPVGTWSIETEFARQNTWALSREVKQYLTALPERTAITPTELQAIRDLPGENYLVDLELAELDMTFNYKFAPHWGAYLIVSGVSYEGGFLDGTIEKFHNTFGFSNSGRKAVRHNDTNIILDLKSEQFASLGETPTRGGLLDPTLGIRYSGARLFKHWDLILEAAVKVPVAGERTLLSTGKADFGIQATLQRFYRNHALYVGASGVYYDGTTSLVPTPAQVIPTLVLGYEQRLGADTHVVLQGYVSPSVYSKHETDLDGLRATKYQLSLGLYHRIGGGLLSFAFTENLVNMGNTPDIGVQLGWTYSPAFRSGV
jgi:Protein of unknown function (DUF3187)